MTHLDILTRLRHSLREHLDPLVADAIAAIVEARAALKALARHCNGEVWDQRLPNGVAKSPAFVAVLRHAEQVATPAVEHWDASGNSIIPLSLAEMEKWHEDLYLALGGRDPELDEIRQFLKFAECCGCRGPFVLLDMTLSTWNCSIEDAAEACSRGRPHVTGEIGPHPVVGFLHEADLDAFLHWVNWCVRDD